MSTLAKRSRVSLGRLVLALAVLGCRVPTVPPPTVFPDAGPDLPADAGRDAGPADAPADGGPPAPPVLPAQSWEVALPVADGAGTSSVAISVHIEPRAESGTALAIIGSGERSNTVLFDVVGPGRLIAREPLTLSLTASPSSCATPTLYVEQAVLGFADDDGDGVHERLRQVDLAPYVTRAVTPDTFPPTWTVVAPVAGEVLELTASEPIDSRAVPFVEGSGRRFALREAAGALSPMRWTLATASLPAFDGYVLGFERAPTDLAGHESAAPTVTFDVPPVEPLRLDGFESGVVGLTADGPVRALEASEIPLEGSVSAFTRGRTVVWFEPEAIVSQISFAFRVHARHPASVYVPLRVRDREGRDLGSTIAGAYVEETGIADGLELQSAYSYGSVPITRSRGPFTMEIDPRGSRERRCSGELPLADDDDVGLTLDAITLM